MGKDGVSVPVNPNLNGGRDEKGRFTKGNPGGPGRPKRAEEIALLDAISTTFPPELVQQTLQDALRLAKEQNSARGMIAVLEFAANYALGKPVQRTQEVQGGLSSILEELDLDENE